MRIALCLFGLMMCPSAWAVISCTIVSGDLDFGFYDHLDISPLETSSINMTVDCHDNVLLIGGGGTVNYTITMDAGLGSGGSYTPRKMASGGDSLDYNLYTDSGYSLIWGDGTGGTGDVSNSINVPGCLSILIFNCPSAAKSETIYGRIPAQQSVDAGSYSDSITVTITY